MQPKARGLYDPRYEHDSCGIGAVVDISGRRSHRIIALGKQVLENLHHRGAAGSDDLTGDGAGILLQIPHELPETHQARALYRTPLSVRVHRSARDRP